jgi:hypothetical protein
MAAIYSASNLAKRTLQRIRNWGSMWGKKHGLLSYPSYDLSDGIPSPMQPGQDTFPLIVLGGLGSVNSCQPDLYSLEVVASPNSLGQR